MIFTKIKLKSLFQVLGLYSSRRKQRKPSAEFFWRDPYKNEVDIILGANTPIPLEIKYGKLNYSGMRAFMKKFKIDDGYIISYQKEDEHQLNGKIIHVIPAFRFVVRCPEI
ncbi:MAG: hypothetical protein DRH90_19810 [Deltaproteobacteria bacterium]|nr:MAG: hypothetical protein DRH90_19810 [Deltaproteobacteria bacterium]RLC13180.1 MAG: hypothetical protein DRI24_16225 [Deltaproteobacteria bacterium]